MHRIRFRQELRQQYLILGELSQYSSTVNYAILADLGALVRRLKNLHLNAYGCELLRELQNGPFGSDFGPIPAFSTRAEWTEQMEEAVA